MMISNKLLRMKDTSTLFGVTPQTLHNWSNEGYTTIIGALKYSWSLNFSDHVLASYVIARKGLGFAEPLPACYKRVLAQVGDLVKPCLNPSSPYYQWAQLSALFKHYGVTPFRSPDPATNLKRKLLAALDTVLDGRNPATGVPPDNLTAGLLTNG